MSRPTRFLTSMTAWAVLATAYAPSRVGAADPVVAVPVQLEALRVTSDLWAAPLDRLSASVSVYDDVALRGGATQHFGDLVEQIPNLTWTGGTSRPRYLQIRGIGENSQYEGETPDASVRFLVDDLDFTGLGTLGGMFDVQQVEILRGPQAGAFGANAAGGLVRLVTNAPTPYWTGQLESSLGTDHLRTGGFAFGGPLVAAQPETLMMRLAVQQSVSDGFRRNLTLNRDTNARDEFFARLRLSVQASPVWRWEGSLLFSEVNNGFDEFALDNNGRLTRSNQPGRDEQRSKAGSLRGHFSGFSAVRVTSVTALSRVTSRYSYDDDWTAGSYAGFSDLRRTRDVLSEELRVDSALTRRAWGWVDRWTLGGYFSEMTEDSAYTNEDPGDLRGLQTRYEAKNTALFGQVAHDFSQATRLLVSLRVEQIDTAGRGAKTRFRKSRATFDPVIELAPAFDDTLVGGKVTLEHALDGRHLVFASVTRGYKGGGINTDARINPPADPLTYGTEYLWNYEVGLRGQGWDRRLAGEVTGFYLDRQRAQVRDSAGFGGNYRFFTTNAPSAFVYGLEAAGVFAVSPAWSVRGSVAWMESALDRFTLGNGNVGGGRRLANTPRYGGTVGPRFRSRSGAFAQLDWVARASQLDSNNQSEARRAFRVLNASVGQAWGGWTLTVWARNLLDRRYEKRVFFFGNEEPDYADTRYEDRADPRQVGVTAVYRF